MRNQLRELMKLYKAEIIARAVLADLAPHCETAMVAGSVRRQSPEVKDIEFVVMPKTQVVIQDLFSPNKREERVSDKFVDAVKKLGTILRGSPTGRYCQVLTVVGIKLDIFIPQRHDFYRILAIRTGSAEYSHQIIARGWNLNGWCGTPNGLRLMAECERVEKTGTWVCICKEPTLPPAWASEEEFFQWLGITFLPPEKRYSDKPLPVPGAKTIQDRIELGEFTPIPE